MKDNTHNLILAIQENKEVLIRRNPSRIMGSLKEKKNTEHK